MSSTKKTEQSAEKDKYIVPEWATRPPQGTHLDVLKAKQLLQKLLIDEKSHYYFGRNPIMCDFVVEHASCSRVHALLLYHRLLKRFAMVDLESCHGTFVEKVRIQPLTPVFIDYDSTFHFGASTRCYTIRANLIDAARQDGGDKALDCMEMENNNKNTFALPTDDFEIDNLTEYNTAQNRRIPQILISLEEARRKNRPRPKLKFTDEEDIINPEDIDPSIGRFRNLVRTAVIPSTSTATKRSQSEIANNNGGEQTEELLNFYAPDAKRANHHHAKSALSTPVGLDSNAAFGPFLMGSTTLGVGMSLNAAPDLDLYASIPPPTKKATVLATTAKMANARFPSVPVGDLSAMDEGDAHAAANKKKYAKEAWPGRKPATSII